MKPLLIFISLTFVLGLLLNNVVAEDSQDSFHTQISIHQSVVRLFDFENPAFEISLEVRPWRQYSMQIDAGIILKDIALSYLLDSESSMFLYNHSGYRLGGQFKYWIKEITPENRKIGHAIYFSMNPFYIENSYNCYLRFNSDSISALHSDSLNWYSDYGDTVSIYKQFYGLNLLIGYQFKFKELLLRPALGLGIRHRYAQHSNRKNPNDKASKSLSYIMDVEGNSWIGNFEFNFTFGYLF